MAKKGKPERWERERNGEVGERVRDPGKVIEAETGKRRNGAETRSRGKD